MKWKQRSSVLYEIFLFVSNKSLARKCASNFRFTHPIQFQNMVVKCYAVKKRPTAKSSTAVSNAMQDLQHSYVSSCESGKKCKCDIWLGLFSAPHK